MRRFQTELKHLFNTGLLIDGVVYPIDAKGICSLDLEKAAARVAQLPRWIELDEEGKKPVIAETPSDRKNQLKKMSSLELMKLAKSMNVTIFNRTADALISDIVEVEERNRLESKVSAPEKPKKSGKSAKKDQE